ncbi:sigma-70 family RNA polymerase sigma factor [Eubacteriales bacterium OttesenSCG-928-M02]|nr:sigma-70 family RNA polymerase sigma factor [Eubacteriales bacterium OttesenSCG-928-M02]
MPMTDTERLANLQKAPEEALGQLMDEYMGLVYTVVKNQLGSFATNEDVEECVSDAFFTLYQQRDRIDVEKGTIKAYLCVIAKRKAITRYHQKNRRKDAVAVLEDMEFIDHETPEGQAMARDEVVALIDAIKSLGQPDAEILFRKYYLGEPSKEIAEKLNMTVSNLDSRAHRAIKKLQPQKGSVIYGGSL